MMVVPTIKQKLDYSHNRTHEHPHPLTPFMLELLLAILYTLPLSNQAIARLGILISNSFQDKGDLPADDRNSAGMSTSAGQRVASPSEGGPNSEVISIVPTLSF